jgi:hypothetical protein
MMLTIHPIFSAKLQETVELNSGSPSGHNGLFKAKFFLQTSEIQRLLTVQRYAGSLVTEMSLNYSPLFVRNSNVSFYVFSRKPKFLLDASLIYRIFSNVVTST